jgi:hypothetical protein
MPNRTVITSVLLALLFNLGWAADRAGQIEPKSPAVKQESQPKAPELQRNSPENKPEIAAPQASQIPWQSLNGGGDINMTSTNFKMKGSVGQSTIGFATSASYQAGIGFWYGSSCMAIPGDANASGSHTLADIIATVNYLFNKPGYPACSASSVLCWLGGLLCRGDWNGSGTVTLADVIQGVNKLFSKPGGPWDAIPSGACCIPAP